MSTLFWFAGHLGPWGIVLVLAGAFSYWRTSPSPRRLLIALADRRYLRFAVGLGVLAWALAMYAQLQGDGYLRFSVTWLWLPSVAVVLVAAVATGCEWWVRAHGESIRVQALFGVFVLIVTAEAMLVAVDDARVVAEEGSEGMVVEYVQYRLEHLGCFAAAAQPTWDPGVFDGRTVIAVLSFQAVNELLGGAGVGSANVDTQYAGKIRKDPELKLLARPFYWLNAPAHCPAATE